MTPGRGWAGGALLVAANAVHGGIGLVVNGMGMPSESLDRLPVDTWTLLSPTLVLWILVQLLVLPRYFFLQPVVAAFGVLEMVLAGWWIRRSRGAPHAARG